MKKILLSFVFVILGLCNAFATVTSTTPSVSYVPNGNTVYAYGFKIFVNSDLQVTRTNSSGVSSVLTLTTDYTVSGAGDASGGNVTTIATYSDGTLEIRRILPYTQETDLVNNDDFDADVLESALDRLVMLNQQLNVDIDEGLQVPAWRGDWVTATVYSLGNLIIGSGNDNMYSCIEAHTSGTWSTDLNGGKWLLALDVSAIADAISIPDVEVGSALKFLRQNSLGTAYEMGETLPVMVASKRGTLIVQNGSDDGYERITAQGISGQVLTSNGPDALPSFQNNNAGELFHAQDQKTTGSHGGGSSAGANDRDLNTVLTSQTWASLASDEVTLDAGTYYIEGSSHTRSNYAMLQLRQTDETIELEGLNAPGNNAGATPILAVVSGIVTFGSETIVKLVSIVQTTTATNGLGEAISLGSYEVYTELKIWKR